MTLRPLALLALAIVALAGLSPRRAAGAPIRVLAIGDSITFGTSSEPTGPGWVEVLADLLGSDYEFVNVGKGGTSSLDWTGLNGGPDYFAIFAEPLLPADMVMIMLGTIDAAGYGETAPVSESQYRTAIQFLVDEILMGGSDRVILTGPPPAWYSLYGEGLLYHYQGIVADICGATVQVVCGPDLYDLLVVGPPDFAPFDVHPTGVGHQKIAGAFFETILAIPEPPTAFLLTIGLVGMAAARRRRRTAVR